MITRSLIAIVLSFGLATLGAAVLATGEEAKEKARDAKETLKEKGETAKEKIKETGEKVKDKAVELKDKAKAKMERRDRRPDMDAKVEMDVRAAQQVLTEKGFDPGPIDGKMGPRTRAAIQDFQRKEGLQVTGQLDAETTAKLGGPRASRAEDTPAASPRTGPKRQSP